MAEETPYLVRRPRRLITVGFNSVEAAELRQRSFQRILLVKPSAVGDVIHTVPVLVRLRQRYPNAQLDWLLTPRIAELVRHHPALSNVVFFDRGRLAQLGRAWQPVRELGRFLSRLRRARYDLVIDLHGQFRSALLCLLSGSPVRIGFAPPSRKPFPGDRRLVKEAYVHGWTGAREGAWVAYTHHISVRKLDVHAVDRYLSLGPMLGLPEGPVDFHIPLPDSATSRVNELLAAHGLDGHPYAVLVPGTTWETKHWLPEGFAAVGRHLTRTGRRIIVAGSANEMRSCREMAALCPGTVDLCGQTTLSELAALLHRATLCVTNDSGSMHLAVAFGRPVVSIFGPTDPVWIGPYRRSESVVSARGIDCAPCYLRKLSACTHAHACMKQVSPAMVIERIQYVESEQARCAS